jgi:hypothetical protein
MLRQHRGWPNRTYNEIAFAVRADTAEDIVRTIGAEGAFEGANPGVEAFGRQIPVATFTIRLQFQHDALQYQSCFEITDR